MQGVPLPREGACWGILEKGSAMNLSDEWLAPMGESELVDLIDDCRCRMKEHRRSGRWIMAHFWRKLAADANEALGELYRREAQLALELEGQQLTVYDALASVSADVLAERWRRPIDGSTTE
jgi:hypothetical protein